MSGSEYTFKGVPRNLGSLLVPNSSKLLILGGSQAPAIMFPA